MKKELPKVSIITPTYNNKDYLKATLMSIESLEYPKDRYEVIIADDGSTDGTREMVAEIKDKFSYPLKYYRQENKGPGVARNLGISKARGELYAFVDSDCRVQKDWLHNLARYFIEEDVGVVGAPVIAYDKDLFFSKCVDYSMNSLIGTGGLRRGKGVRLAKYYPRSGNMAVSKKAIDKVGGFKQSYYGEDVELSFRIKKAGFSIRYAPDAFVWHTEKTNLLSFTKQVFNKGFARVSLSRMHRELLEPLHLLPAIMVTLFLTLASLSIIYPHMLKILLALISIYMLILLLSGIFATKKIGDYRAIVVVPLLLAIQHLSYGVGFLVALFKLKR